MANDKILSDLLNPAQTQLDLTPVEDAAGQLTYQMGVEPEPEDDPEPTGTLLDFIDHYENLVYYMSEDDLAQVANDVIEGYEEDCNSNSGFYDTIKEYIRELGLSGDEYVSVPFEGACTAYHPLLMEAGVKFQAKASVELLPAKGPAKTRIIGDKTEELEIRAQEQQEHLNWQITQQMPEYDDNTEKALLHTSLLGNAFKKKTYDLIENRPRDMMLTVDRLVVNNGCDNIESAERSTEIQYISELDLAQGIHSGLYRDDADVGKPYQIEKSEVQQEIDRMMGLHNEYGAGYQVLEQHVYMDLSGLEDPSGVPLPYVIVVEKQSQQVLSIRRNWKEGGNKFKKRCWYAHYRFVPGFGFYSLGYLHLLGGFQRTLTAIMRSLVDSGSFANLQGGFKSKQMRILDDDQPIQPGEFKDVENFGEDISKAIVPLNFKEPSSTLFSMMQFIESRGLKFADSTEQVLADSTNYGPVGTTMALLDASTKFFSAVHKRLFRAQSQELKLLEELNYENLPENAEEIEFNIPGKTIRITREHYSDAIDVIPVSDPNTPSQAHRLTLAQTKLQAALQAPQVHDVREAYRDFYIALDGGEDLEKLLPTPQQAQPNDPITDIMLASQGQPIKAFPDQNHDAHIAVKTSFIQDPTMGGDESMQQAVPSLLANIREHRVLKFQQQMEGAMQATPDIGIAEAAQQVAQFNQYREENPLGAQDPKQMLAQAEIMDKQNDARKIALEERKMENELAVDQGELLLEKRKQDLEMMKNQIKLENANQQQRFKEAIDFIQSALGG